MFSIDASVTELDQDIFACFVALKLALLILNSFDLGILHQLRIEPDQFHNDALDWKEASESVRPGMNIFDAALKRRGQRAFRSTSIVKAWLSIASCSGSPSSAERTALIKREFDRLAAVFYFGGKDDLATVLIDDCHAGGLRAGIDLQPQVRYGRGRDLPLENDCERDAPEDRGFALIQEQSGAAFGSGRKGLFGCLKLEQPFEKYEK